MEKKLDAFTESYLEAALWSSTDEDGNPLDRNPYEFSGELIEDAIRDCNAFREVASGLLEERADEYGGQDFWLTRNGHGAGFWDGDWPENGDKLTAMAKCFPEVNLYVAADELIYGD